jgi:glycosyltransferase domain-containing protein
MVAIIVPTMNRSGFIRRLLNYYSNCSIKNSIYIADSSDDEKHINEIKLAINDVSSKLKVVYGHYLNTNIEESKRLILDQVTEKYASYCGDDDFLVPGTLTKCAKFLDNNLDYSNCHGIGVCFMMKNDPLCGDIQVASDYKLLSNESDDPHIRIYDYLTNYWPIWSVRRVDEFKRTLKFLQNIPLESFREITMGAIPIIQGKTKLIDELYVVRQMHSKRFQNPDPMTAFLLEGWHTSYKEMCRVIDNEMKIITTTDKTKFDAFVKQGFANYYSGVLKSKISKKENSSLTMAKLFVKEHSPFISYIFYKYFAKGLSLPRLRNRKSKYFIEFNEISEFLKKYNY